MPGSRRTCLSRARNPSECDGGPVENMFLQEHLSYRNVRTKWRKLFFRYRLASALFSLPERRVKVLRGLRVAGGFLDSAARQGLARPPAPLERQGLLFGYAFLQFLSLIPNCP